MPGHNQCKFCKKVLFEDHVYVNKTNAHYTVCFDCSKNKLKERVTNKHHVYVDLGMKEEYGIKFVYGNDDEVDIKLREQILKLDNVRVDLLVAIDRGLTKELKDDIIRQLDDAMAEIMRVV